MSTTIPAAKFVTVTEVAARYNRTTGRIRQICLKYGLGRTVANKLRVLSPHEADEIGRLIRQAEKRLGK